MKRYKLKKDLPTFELGDEFVLIEGIGLQHVIEGCAGAIVYTEATLEKFPNILTDWFEEIKEPTRWKPEKYDEQYYYIENTGWICDDTWRDAVSIDRERLEIGNCFQTKEETERVAEYLKALTVVRGDATTKFINGNRNWYVYYDTNSNLLCSSISCSMLDNGIFGLPYFATNEDARRSIEQHKDEWLTIFGIEEEE